MSDMHVDFSGSPTVALEQMAFNGKYLLSFADQSATVTLELDQQSVRNLMEAVKEQPCSMKPLSVI